MMKHRNWLKVVIMCLVLLSVLVLYAEMAQAQGRSADAKDMMEREGVSGSLATKEFDQSKMPGRGKKAIAFGSVVAMVAVMKWL
jgi:hypothetical protein